MEDYLHLYYVILATLNEVKHIDGKIVVYGDCRNIDELNGLEPLSDTARKLKTLILRNQMPHLKGTCFFQKKPYDWIQRQLDSGSKAMRLDEQTNHKMELAKAHLAHRAQIQNQHRTNVLERFRNGRNQNQQTS